MPQRTNDLQDLVALIQTALAPKGAKVTPSALVDIPGLKATEIDVLIEGEFGPYNLKIAVEVKDERRPLDIGTFREYLGKYRGECRVHVDKYVLVSRRGFTEQVRNAARLADVELLTLDEAEDKNWAAEGHGTLHFEFPPHICQIHVTPTIKGVDSKRLMSSAELLCGSCGRVIGKVIDQAKRSVFQNLWRSHPERVQTLWEHVRKSPHGHAHMAVTATRAKGMKVRVDGADHRIESMEIQVHAVSAKSSLRCSSYRMESSSGSIKNFHRFQATAANKVFDFVVPEDPFEQRAALKISSADAAPKRRRRNR